MVAWPGTTLSFSGQTKKGEAFFNHSHYFAFLVNPLNSLTITPGLPTRARSFYSPLNCFRPTPMLFRITRTFSLPRPAPYPYLSQIVASAQNSIFDIEGEAIFFASEIRGVEKKSAACRLMFVYAIYVTGKECVRAN